MANKIAMGMLCFSRPIHTALTIAFTLHNKSDKTDFFPFYGIHKHQTPPSRTLDGMLKTLYSECGLQFFYMGEDKPNNVQGNVDNLMGTLSALLGYSCFAKIDDDVLIGKGSDVGMANILIALGPEKCYMLMGQAVPEHMRRHNPFCWEAQVNGCRVVQRTQKACPMETYTFIANTCLKFLRENSMSVSCENPRGTYGPLTRKIVNAGGKVCLALTPAIQMQHIGLTTTIEKGNPARAWAPARSWDPMDEVIEIPGFDFSKWEASHKDSSQKAFAIETMEALRPTMHEQYLPHLDILLDWISKYAPETEPINVPNRLENRPTAPKPVQRVVRHKAEPGMVLRKLPDGRVVRSPGPVRRVVIRQNT